MEKNQKTYLKSLTSMVAVAISKIDTIMQEPSTNDRGKKVAAIMNGLEIENDAAMHFGLGYSFAKIGKIKKHNNRIHSDRATCPANGECQTAPGQ